MSKLLSHNDSAYVLIDAMLVYNINLYLGPRLSIFLLLAIRMFETYNWPYCCRSIVYIVLIATIIINVCIIPRMKHTVKEVEVVWACDQKRGTLCRKECDCYESTWEKEERKT